MTQREWFETLRDVEPLMRQTMAVGILARMSGYGTADRFDPWMDVSNLVNAIEAYNRIAEQLPPDK